MTPTRARIPLTVFILGIGIFCLGTSEFMIAGLLPEMSADLGTTVPVTSALVSAFALGMIIGAPAMAVGTLRLPRRTVLVAALVVFAVVHLVPLVSDSFTVIAVSRVVAAFACGAFWAVGAVVAVRSSPPNAAGKALAVLAGGLTLSYVAGVPIGTWIGQSFGWRATFVVVAVASAVVAVVVAMAIRPAPVDDDPAPLRERIRPELVVFRSPHVWLVLGLTAVFQAALIATFTFLAPLLTDVTGLPSGAVPIVLLVFGVGSLLGITAGGYLADRSIFGTVFCGLGGMLVALIVLALAADVPAVAVTAVAVLGIFAYSLAPALNARVFSIAGDAPTLAAAVNTSAFNVGNFAGPAAGALAIQAAGFSAPIGASIALVVVALGVAGVALRFERRRVATVSGSGTPRSSHRPPTMVENSG